MKALFLACLVVLLMSCSRNNSHVVELTLRSSADGAAIKANDPQVTDALKILDAVALNHGFTQQPKPKDPQTLSYSHYTDYAHIQIDLTALLQEDDRKLKFTFDEPEWPESKRSKEAREELTDKLKEKFGAGFVENIR